MDPSCAAGVGRSGNIPYLKYGECLFGRAVSVVLALAGIALFIMLVLGGFKYLSSGGDPKALDSAKKTLTYAIGGMILLVLSVIVLRLIGAITGADLIHFYINR
ncbi:hypothetical protein A2955_02560 [Candidatus Woesebacteria bacterium RIFCSPLOWO2_01_FULL_37_19]|uniref:Uncharacterized protein n=2 Tax=Candidatus Woeseibacteriota TaxID=1752722 RepID=A0A1F8AZ49_9BACT|nr:MAG: hypothetical protein A2771_04075 [Candidatus Woesebacteria bacterium RIFCSPHIGHO2_01_FULL_38_26b]OGM56789.1 MAG: hypothetical protein A2955_02560 [Candidatus Woesebacteria bacterium RIFCSPLOWO2_01_FULL_37_19]